MMPCQSPAPARAIRPWASGWLIIGFGPGAANCIVALGVVTSTLEPGAQPARKTSDITNKLETSSFFISTSKANEISFGSLYRDNYSELPTRSVNRPEQGTHLHCLL